MVKPRFVKLIVSAIVCAVLIAAGVYYAENFSGPSSGPSRAERVRMDLEVAEAEQEVAEAKHALDAELAKPMELISKLGPEGISEQMDLLTRAQANYARKANHLKLLKDARAKLNQ